MFGVGHVGRQMIAARRGVVVEPAALDLSFMVPDSLDGRITFTRASTATYFDATGTTQTAAINVPRFDYDPATLALRGLLLEELRTNLLLNSATLSTQSLAVIAQTYILSFYGTGTITKSGTATGALVGTGTGRVFQTVTPTAGTLTLTVTGSVFNAQLEVGAFPTSWIPTAGATATRSADVAVMTGTNFSTWFNNVTGSFAIDTLYSVAGVGAFGRSTELSDGTTNNSVTLIPDFLNSRYQFGSTIATVAGTSLTVPGAPTVGIVNKASLAYGANRSLCANTGSGASGVQSTPGGIATVNRINLGNRAANDRALNGYLRRLRFWPRALSDTELQSVTR